MTALDWNEVPGGELASGEDWAYLIIRDPGNVVLTRWAPRPGETGSEVAAQAALYAIRLGGAYEAVPEAADAVVQHCRSAAQAFEAGLDVAGQRAWCRGYQAGAR